MTTATKHREQPAALGHLNPDDILTLTQIMARNGDVPANVGGWVLVDGYAGATHRANGVVGEVAGQYGDWYVCVQGCDALSLPHSHPDYVPSAGTAWAHVPRPQDIDWGYVPSQYYTRDGWRIG